MLFYYGFTTALLRLYYWSQLLAEAVCVQPDPDEVDLQYMLRLY